MNAEQWARVKTLFNAVLDKEPDERASFLALAAGEDIALHDAVARLVASHDEPDNFMESSAAEMHSPELVDSPPPGGRIGPYRLIREIGRGGMGTVYLGARDDGEFRHQVALKLVNRGMDTDLILRRFRYERQILAELDHPNIARLLDGGTTEDGRPYFVMEYIEGEAIDAYCVKRELPLTSRLELFRTVCAAVQYAHRNLIVHRDIKPNNILVTSSGVPKLLDFGIAKLLHPAHEASTTTGLMTMRALTPEYASPEQVRGEPITTTSDVYSLGVLLYELLTGRRPYEVDSRRPDDIARTVCETDPVPPSNAVTGNDVEGLRRRLRGDLDTIVLMAMQKDAQRRYASVQQLSDDIDRHLRGLPVTARRDTKGYRAAKFVRRNRFVVATAVAVVLSLVAGLATTMWQARVAQAERARAERRFAEVRTLATSFLFELHDAIVDLPGSTPVRGLLVKRALTSLDGLAKEAQGDLPLQRDLAVAYERVGRVQGNSYNSNLGDTEGALVSYRKSLAIRERMARENPESLELQNELANGYSGLADISSAVADLAEAAKDYQRAIDIRQELRTKHPADQDNRSTLAELYNFLGDTQGMEGYANLGDVPGALKSYRQSVKLREEVWKDSPRSIRNNVGLANSLMNLGFLASNVGDTSGGAQVRRSVEILERVVASDPNNATRRMALLSGYARLRSVNAETGHIDDAIAVDRETVAMLAEMLETDSTNTLIRRNLGAMTNWLGRDLRTAGNSSLALVQHRKALAIAEGLSANDPKSSEHLHDVAWTHYLLGEILSDVHDDKTALAEYRNAATRKERLRIAEPTNTRHGDDLGLIYTGMGRLLTRTGELAEADAMIRKAIPLAEAAAARSATNMKARINLALTYVGAAGYHASMTTSTSGAAKVAEWREARSFYKKGSDIWQSLKREQRLSISQAKNLADATHRMQTCDAALAQLLEPASRPASTKGD